LAGSAAGSEASRREGHPEGPGHGLGHQGTVEGLSSRLRWLDASPQGSRPEGGGEVTDQPAPYVLAYNVRLKKHVVIETATDNVVAERDTREAAKAEHDRLTECWLKSAPDCTGMTPPEGVLE
jgi:hypothetical protein